jgi:hypothetical protein
MYHIWLHIPSLNQCPKLIIKTAVQVAGVERAGGMAGVVVGIPAGGLGGTHDCSEGAIPGLRPRPNMYHIWLHIPSLNQCPKLIIKTAVQVIHRLTSIDIYGKEKNIVQQRKQ